MIGKRIGRQNPRGRHLDRMVWKAIALAVVLAGSIVGCQHKSTLTPSVFTTPTPTPVFPTTERPTSSPQNQISPTPSLRPTVDRTDAFVIQLQSRQFVPEAEIQSGLDWLRTVPHRRVHVLLQLYEPLDSAAKTLLEQSGIQLLNYVPSNAWFASLPNDLPPDNPTFAMVRWFGPILPEDKVHSGLLDGSIGGWALREGNRIALEVAFFADVDLDSGQQILLKHDAVIIGSTPLSNKLTVEISKDAVLFLAAEDSVRWIDIVPPPPTTDSEGG